MTYIPCKERTFTYRISAIEFSKPYLRWLRHLCERLGVGDTRTLWQDAFTEYDDAYLKQILASGWEKVPRGGDSPVESLDAVILEFFPAGRSEIPEPEVIHILENTPPLAQIRRHFPNDTLEKSLTAYEVLHLRFDGLTHLAESIIHQYGKQGEFIVYDIQVESRLANAGGRTGSVEEFIEDFTKIDSTPSLFTAGLQYDVVSRSPREAILHVRECEWARYFRERHPSVGYLMACSTDEVAYRAFNPSLRMQRTKTLMEGGEMCDFRIFPIGGDECYGGGVGGSSGKIEYL